MPTDWKNVLVRIDERRYLIPRSYKPGMLTDAVIYADRAMLDTLLKDQSLEQAANMTMLPGVVGRPVAMPDVHQGYGFPIGGVAATDAKAGVVSPAAIGYDINCGVRLLASSLSVAEVRPKLEPLVDQLFRVVPSGTGTGGRLKLKRDILGRVVSRGVAWALQEGYGEPADQNRIESQGCIPGADPDAVSDRAFARGADQLGTLGSGNHFLEIDYVDEIFDEDAARGFGLAPGQIVVLVHTGSRGFGHQVCTDYLKVMLHAMVKYGIRLPDRELACAPIKSMEGQQYLGAMACAANFAFVNRQLISHWVRQVFDRTFGKAGSLPIVYDVAHNIAKFEKHLIEGVERLVLVHRKGATRALPAGHPEVPAEYRPFGQPVIIPGDMGRASFVLVGTPAGSVEALGSSCHGAGRLLSRTAARKGRDARVEQDRLAGKGILVRASSRDGIVEEVPEAYKDVEDVTRIVESAGIARRVARLKPMGVVKG
ncbi:MAG: RtcB family protein [Acidobacteria bacterium]|nr:RtcB family protein [Acidobacteriota bacterium]